jgi:endonuclease YncB( thermonuclease family)
MTEVYRDKRRSFTWIRVGLFLAGIAIGAGGTLALQKLLRSGDKPIFVAVDGDTVKVNQARVFNVSFRAAGYDTPELRHAKCPAEREAALQLKKRVQMAIDAGTFTAELTGRKAGFGRPEAIFKIGGRNLGNQLIAEGLAVKWRRGVKPDWCKKLANG